MKIIKKIFSKLHVYVLWLLASVMLWAWIFTIITDTRAQYKVTLFADTYAGKTTELAMRLEENLPEGLKMIKVRLFEYAMYLEADINNADLFIIRQSEAEKYISAYVPLEELELPAGDYEYYTAEGTAYGILIYDGTQTGLSEYLTYDMEGLPQENYYLFFGNKSLHLGQEDSVDGAALTVAAELLTME